MVDEDKGQEAGHGTRPDLAPGTKGNEIESDVQETLKLIQKDKELHKEWKDFVEKFKSPQFKESITRALERVKSELSSTQLNDSAEGSQPSAHVSQKAPHSDSIFESFNHLLESLDQDESLRTKVKQFTEKLKNPATLEKLKTILQNTLDGQYCEEAHRHTGVDFCGGQSLFQEGSGDEGAEMGELERSTFLLASF